VGLALLAAMAAGCTGTGDQPASSPVGQFFRGTTEEPTSIDEALLEPVQTCPRVRIQPGTEAIRREAAGEGEDRLRWQASIARTARECEPVGEGEGQALAVRVGVSGRVIEGTQGAPDVVELPLRVAVREGDEVTYSRLHNVRVEMASASEPWAFVDDQVRIAAPEGARIVVGFDG
jgi:hypothetical protein